MGLRFDGLRIIAVTAEGNFGAHLEFSDGLVVLRADNTSGKSTVLQSMLYLLGMERMLTVRKEVPLPHSMTDKLFTPDGREIPVVESYVMGEISNRDGRTCTLRRQVKSANASARDLIQVYEGAVLSGGTEVESTDFYLGRKGAASNPRGFYSFLSEFVGWELPVILREDGAEAQLYMEQVFPLFFVEQKRGWAGIQAQMPPYPGVPDARRRAREFVLGIKRYDRTRRTLVLKNQRTRIEEEWRSHYREATDIFGQAGAELKNLPTSATGMWPPEPMPFIAVSEGTATAPLSTALATVKTALQSANSSPIPSADANAQATSKELSEAEERLASLGSAVLAVEDQYRLEGSEQAGIRRRISTLTQDRTKFQDALTLTRLGGGGGLPHSGDDCPTCHQVLPATVLLMDENSPSMSLEENVKFIDEQVAAFEAMLRESLLRQDERQRQLIGLKDAATETRRRIRALKNTLVAAGSSPAEAAVERKVRLEWRLDQLQNLQLRAEALFESLEKLSDEYASVSAELDEAKQASLSATERSSIATLQANLIQQLVAYGFRSVEPHEVNISEESLLPVHEGFDLGANVSGSDWVRLTWAYLVALLEVARSHSTNHLGFLVFDEPRQQDANPQSFAALLARASAAGSNSQQVILATSEEVSSLEPALVGLGADYIQFGTRLLQPMPA